MTQLLENDTRYSQLQVNALLLNRYQNGQDSMGAHNDLNTCMHPSYLIASISLGACRRFVFQQIDTNEKTSIYLPSGSLLLMLGKEIQEQYIHGLPKTTICMDERWNLNFRLHKYL